MPADPVIHPGPRAAPGTFAPPTDGCHDRARPRPANAERRSGSYDTGNRGPLFGIGPHAPQSRALLRTGRFAVGLRPSTFGSGAPVRRMPVDVLPSRSAAVPEPVYVFASGSPGASMLADIRASGSHTGLLPAALFAGSSAPVAPTDAWVADLQAPSSVPAGGAGRFDPGPRAGLLSGVLMLVSGLASAACTVGGGGMAFGAINPLAQVPVDSTGAITVTCAEATPYTIALVGALGGNGLYAMAGPGDALQYGLYTDPLRSLVWGDGTGGSQTVGGSTDATGTTHTVYGRVPPQPMARAGAYVDVITVIVTW